MRWSPPDAGIISGARRNRKGRSVEVVIVWRGDDAFTRDLKKPLRRRSAAHRSIAAAASHVNRMRCSVSRVCQNSQETRAWSKKTWFSERSTRLQRALTVSADEPAAVLLPVELARNPKRAQIWFEAATIPWMPE